MLQPKVCKIEYAAGCYTQGIVYGNRFDKLIECCLWFGRWFNNTGNTKCASFNGGRNEDRDGFNLATRGGELKLCLRARGIESEINFCPFCGAKVEVIQTKMVQLKKRTKEVFDGYDETDVRIVTPPVAAIQ